MTRKLPALLAIPFLASMALAQVQTWKIDPNHTAPQFSVRHMGISTVRGAFTKVSGTVQYDPANVSKSSLEITIKNYFEVDKYPTLTFKSTKVEAAGEGRLKVTGDLTIHGVTKPIVLSVEGPSKPMTDPRGNQHMGASATTAIKRTDFGVGSSNPMIGEDINITIDVEMVIPNPNPPPPPPPPTK